MAVGLGFRVQPAIAAAASTAIPPAIRPSFSFGVMGYLPVLLDT
jgi:hypothetical protein